MMDPTYTGPKMEVRRSPSSYATPWQRESETAARDEKVHDLDEESGVCGSRWVEVATADGRVSLRQVSLTWEDLLDPQEGDHVPHGDEHSETIHDTQGALKGLFRTRGRGDVKVYDDMKMIWEDETISQVSPDIAVIFGVKNPERRRDSFLEKEEGTRPSFVLEVTSRYTAYVDRGKKPGIYRKARVQEYLIVDRLKSPWTITGYRLDSTGRRQRLRPDKQDRYLAKTLGVYFSIGEGGEGLVLQDAVTGEILLGPLEAQLKETEARKAAERQAAEEAEARRKETEARKAAERQAAEEAEARKAAERQAAEEAEARKAAERQTAEEAEARRKETEARKAAERQAAEADAQVQVLLAEVERLKSADG
jgi:Uma2 family endonuclease